MVAYYDGRVAQMQAGYARQMPAWVDVMVADLQRVLRGRRVLEVACGSGHWTALAAATAGHVIAVDAAPRMLAAARAKKLPRQRVTLRLGNAYAPDEVAGEVDAGLAMQWVSHVPRRRFGVFLDAWHARLGRGAVGFVSDNRWYPQMRPQPYPKPGEQDTYELRTLPDGSIYEIVKNYLTEDELRSIFQPRVSDLVLHVEVYQWWLSYTLP